MLIISVLFKKSEAYLLSSANHLLPVGGMVSSPLHGLLLVSFMASWNECFWTEVPFFFSDILARLTSLEKSNNVTLK